MAMAVTLLARREHGRRELERKLRGRGVEGEVVAEVVARLLERGHLSEQRFVESLLRQRLRQGYGPARLLADLQAKQADPEVYQPLLAALEVDWLERAREQREQRFGPRLPESGTERARQGRYLTRRGFTTGVVMRALTDNGD